MGARQLPDVHSLSCVGFEVLLTVISPVLEPATSDVGLPY